uniref:Phospholipase A2 n=1 Tax=Anopheles farauti TaxID=69004 RepID=A0A182QXM2_9DIPT
MCAKVRTPRGTPDSSNAVLVLLLAASAACGALLNDTVSEASTGARDARFLAFGEGLTSDEFSLYPTSWTEDYTGENTVPSDDGSELVRLVEGGSDLSPDPYETIELRPYGRPIGSSPTSKYGDDGSYHHLGTGTDISRAPFDAAIFDTSTGAELGTDGGYLPIAAALQSQEFFRGMLERFGVYQYLGGSQSKDDAGGSTASTSSGLSTHLQRIIPHRFRPHFVNTAKGLRNIPAQLNDGQLQPAPEDGGFDGVQPPGGQTGQAVGAGSGAASAGSAAGGTKASSAAGGSSSSGTIGSLFNSFKRKVKAIYPGTVWCGDGNQAKSENDIGFFYLTDSCCRAHDLCPITIAAGEQFNRLKNNGYFTRSHCDCDKQFFNCLKNANTLVSRQIGYTYFNLLKPQCFRYEHPKLNCTKRSKGKCLSYVVDEKQSKRWQWFDNLIF